MEFLSSPALQNSGELCHVRAVFVQLRGALAYLRCMLWLCLALLGSTQQAHAETSPAGGAGSSRGVELKPSFDFLVDTTGQLAIDTIEQQASGSFAPIARFKPVLLESSTLWFRFDALVENPGPSWHLSIPLPGVESVTLYFRDGAGRWISQQAGSRHAISTWPQPGSYPVFSLGEERNKFVRYYLRINHSRVPFSTLPTLVSSSQFITKSQTEHMLLGVYFGLTALVIALALANAIAYRDSGFGSYAAYVTMFAGAQATFTGVAGLYWWPEWPGLNNTTKLLLPVLAAACAMWFVRTVVTPRRFSRALDGLMLALIGLLTAVSVCDVMLPSRESFALIHFLVSVSIAALLMVLGVGLFEGDRHTRWVALGFLPVVLATLLPLLRNLGVISSSFWTEYALVLGSAIEVPVLFYGLQRRVSQRRNVNARASRLSNVDPLTGLYSSAMLLGKLEQSLGTYQRYKLPFALVLVNLSNLASLQRQHGRETADSALVLAAACIRGVAHSTDTVARVGDTQFALLMEGPITADAANDIATRLLASGLRPSSQLPDAEPLQFHIAVGHMNAEVSIAPAESDAFLKRMLKALKDMNDGSRKAIRLVKL